jgi:hypothetical protein
MPPAAPVTIATLPSSEKSSVGESPRTVSASNAAGLTLTKRSYRTPNDRISARLRRRGAVVASFQLPEELKSELRRRPSPGRRGGFSGDSYIDILTPGVVVMLAVSTDGWVGIGFIEDINRGTMDSLLVSPIWRGALNLVSVAQSVLSIVVQSLIVIGLSGDADRDRDHGHAAADVSLLGADAAEPPARVDPVDGQVQPGQWAAEAGRSAAAADADWGLIATRIGFLAVLLLASATFATRAFNVYRRSIRARRES